MSRRHLHYCCLCGDVLYACYESGSNEEGCANAAPFEREYCSGCCVDEREPDDDEDDIATPEPVAGVPRS